MKYIKFFNENELLEKLKDTDYVKRNKPKTYGPHTPNWSSNSVEDIKVYDDFKFEPNSIAMMRFDDNPNLFCLDLDNVYTSNEIQFETPTFNIKSPYGAHHYFTVPDELRDDIISLGKGVESISKFKDKVEAALKDESIKMEFFLGSHSKRVMFIGNNSYYKPQNSIDNIRDITIEDIEYLKAYVENPLSISKKQGDRKVLNYMNPSVAKYAYKIIKNNKIDPVEFNMRINRSSYKGDITQKTFGSHRNNFLMSVMGYFGSSGFMKSWDDLKTLMHIINDSLPEPYPVKKLESQILHDSKKDYYEYENISIIKSEEPVDCQEYLHNTPRVFIGLNIERKTNTDALLFIDLRDDRHPVIEKIINGPHREIYETIYSSLVTQHHRFFYDDDNNLKSVFDPSKCPIVRIINSPYSNKLITYDSKILMIDLGYYRFNKKISEFLENPSDKTQEQLLDGVKHTPQYQVFTRNLFPNKEVYATFMGSLQYFLKTKSYLSISCFIRDSNGSTGKDSILTPFLRQMIYGSPLSEKYQNESENTYKSISSNEPYIVSAHTFVNDETTPYVTSNLLIVNEDGGNVSIDRFNRKWQTVVKNERINSKVLYSDRKTVRNHLFTIRYSNTEGDLINYADTNTRIYISEAQQDITKQEWDDMFSKYSEIPSMQGELSILEYEDAWLEYILFTDWSKLGYKGQNVLPGDLSSSTTIEDVETEISKEHNENKDSIAVMRYFINPTTKQVNQANINEIVNSPNHKLYLLAMQFDVIASPDKYPNDTLQMLLGENKKYVHKGGRDRLRLSEFMALLRHCGFVGSDSDRQFLRQMFTKGSAEGRNPDIKYKKE